MYDEVDIQFADNLNSKCVEHESSSSLSTSTDSSNSEIQMQGPSTSNMAYHQTSDLPNSAPTSPKPKRIRNRGNKDLSEDQLRKRQQESNENVYKPCVKINNLTKYDVWNHTILQQFCDIILSKK